MILSLKEPFVIKTNGLHTFFNEFQFSNLREVFSGVKFDFRMVHLHKKGLIFEKDCSIEQFTLNELSPSDKFAPYLDYKYVNQTFKNIKIDWSSFGFPEQLTSETTFWLGMKGAYTPGHIDAVDCNLHYVLEGRKRWILVSPEQQNNLDLTRTPFEISTIYSKLNLFHCEDISNLSAEQKPQNDLKIQQVMLEPGDLLYIPFGWCHFVECCEDFTVSLNTWLPLNSQENEEGYLRERVAFWLNQVLNQGREDLCFECKDVHLDRKSFDIEEISERLTTVIEANDYSVSKLDEVTIKGVEKASSTLVNKTLFDILCEPKLLSTIYRTLKKDCACAPATPTLRLEVCIDSMESVVNAMLGGAARLEICSDLQQAGLTPTVNLVQQILQFKRLLRSPVELFVMIRPNNDFFCLQNDEPLMKSVTESIQSFKRMRVDGFVFGFLSKTVKGKVVIDERCGDLVGLCSPLPCTFHRAFDELIQLNTDDTLASHLDVIKSYGYNRILSSGGHPNSAIEGLSKLVEMKSYCDQFNNGFIIMPGCGIKVDNFEIFPRNGFREIHGSFKVDGVTSLEGVAKVVKYSDDVAVPCKKAKLA